MIKVLTITFDDEKKEANFYGNLSPDEAILILFKAAKQGMFNKKLKEKSIDSQ